MAKRMLVVLALLVAGFFVYRMVQPEPPAPAPAKEAAKAAEPVVEGKDLNAFFPKAGDGYELKFTQEKEGYAQADLLMNGKRLAQLSISDTNANPSARDKFKDTVRKIDGRPVAAVGSQGTALLVGDRYQIQVRSLGPEFKAEQRDEWLSRFDARRLARREAER